MVHNDYIIMVNTWCVEMMCLISHSTANGRELIMAVINNNSPSSRYLMMLHSRDTPKPTTSDEMVDELLDDVVLSTMVSSINLPFNWPGVLSKHETIVLLMEDSWFTNWWWISQRKLTEIPRSCIRKLWKPELYQLGPWFAPNRCIRRFKAIYHRLQPGKYIWIELPKPKHKFWIWFSVVPNMLQKKLPP